MKTIHAKMVCSAIILIFLCGGIVGAGQAEKPTITINPIGTLTIGDLLIVSGNTTLPTDSGLMITVIATKTCSGVCSGLGIDSKVRPGTGGNNFWSVALDTSDFGQGTYVFNVTHTLVNTLEDFRYGETSATSEFRMIGEAVPEVKKPVSINVKDGYISLDPIGTKHVGDAFLCTGTTNLPAGADILWEIGPDTSKGPVANPSRYETGNGFVLPGKDSNRISRAIDTWDYKPGVYNISCSTSKGDLTKGEWIKGEITDLIQFTVV